MENIGTENYAFEDENVQRKMRPDGTRLHNQAQEHLRNNDINTDDGDVIHQHENDEGAGIREHDQASAECPPNGKSTRKKTRKHLTQADQNTVGEISTDGYEIVQRIRKKKSRSKQRKEARNDRGIFDSDLPAQLNNRDFYQRDLWLDKTALNGGLDVIENCSELCKELRLSLGNGDVNDKQREPPVQLSVDLFAGSVFSHQGSDNYSYETSATQSANNTKSDHHKKSKSKKANSKSNTSKQELTKMNKIKKHINLKQRSSKVFVVTSGSSIHVTAFPGTSRLQPGSQPANRDSELGKPEVEAEQKFPEPLGFCKLLARFPILCFTVLTCLHLIVIGITLGLVLTGHDVFPAVFDSLPLYIYNSDRLKELSWKSRQTYERFVFRPVYGLSFNTGYRGRLKDAFEVIFEDPNGNVLTKDHLERIHHAEERLFNIERYQEHFCLWDINYNCMKPQSIIRLFDGTYSHIDPVFSGLNFLNVCDVMYKASIYNETREFMELFVGKDFIATHDTCGTAITRTYLPLGWPLYVIDGRYGTEEDVNMFLSDFLKPETEKVRDFTLIGILDLYYISKLLYEHDLVQQALIDIKLAIGSFLFIFVFMAIQTGSIIVTSLGILSILSSFVCTNLLYRYAMQYTYFGYFHIMSIFLILGIGTDDLFVFYDTWRLTGHTEYPDDSYRLSDCYRKAAKTTFVSSFTTIIAFFVSGLSPLLPVQTFGIFTAILVAFNYVWVVVYFPTVIMLHHTKTKFIWLKLTAVVANTFCGAKRKLSDDIRRDSLAISDSLKTESIDETSSSKDLIPPSSDDSRRSILNNKSRHQKITPGSRKTSETLSYAHHIPKPLDLKEIKSDAQLQEYLERKQVKPKKNFEDRNKVVLFLRNGFFDFMTKRAVKVLCPLLFLGVGIFFIYQATLIEPDAEQVRIFRPTHNYAKAYNRHYSAFKRNRDDEYQRLYLVWGMDEADIRDCDRKSGEYCFGKPTWDDQFDMNTPESQLAFKNLCERMENMDSDMLGKLRIQSDSATGKPRIHCFAKDFDNYFKKLLSTYHAANLDVSLPVNEGNISTLMSFLPYVYNQGLPGGLKNFFEIASMFWLTNGYTMNPTADYMKYNFLLADEIIPGVTKDAYFSQSGLYYGTKTKFLAIEINTTMNVFNLGHTEGLPVRDEWEKFITSINEGMPPPLQRGIQVTETLWHWLAVQKTLSDSAISGIIVGLLTTWPILILTTMNVVIGTIACIIIGLVTACVVGIIPLVGWKLGVLESINLSMIIGLAVDHIVHLAEAYQACPSPRRADRVRYMLESIGLSVLSGAATTLGAAVFMLGAQIQFFFQFGIFIITIIGLALVFSMLGFTALLSLCGPEGNTGYIPAMCKWLVKKCARKKPTNQRDPDENKKPSNPNALPGIAI